MTSNTLPSTMVAVCTPEQIPLESLWTSILSICGLSSEVHQSRYSSDVCSIAFWQSIWNAKSGAKCCPKAFLLFVRRVSSQQFNISIAFISTSFGDGMCWFVVSKQYVFKIIDSKISCWLLKGSFFSNWPIRLRYGGLHLPGNIEIEFIQYLYMIVRTTG